MESVERDIDVPAAASAPVRAFLRIAAAAVLLGGAWAPAVAADFYQGKSVNIVVSYPAGDGNDVYARLLARHLGSHIPGNPTFVVTNRPGASGLLGANHIYNVAPKDGLTFGIISRSVAIQQLTENPGVKFDATKFGWLGTASSYRDDAYGLIVRSGININ